MKIPTFDQLMNPLLRALQVLGRSATIEESYEKVVELEAIPEDVLAKLHKPETSNQTEVAYRLAWARTYLKKFGLLENSSRGVWSLTAKAKDVKDIDPKHVVQFVRDIDAKEKKSPQTAAVPSGALQEGSDEVEVDSWKTELHMILTEKISPDGLERLVQRLLRESGFTQVEVTGRTGDGGIDGRGIARIHGFMSFHVLFQCKRYKGTVGASEIRDFRGAMVGRADKGLFLTTGAFSPAAVKEATRDGAPPIDLVDGEDLAEKLREFDLGITRTTVEVVKVNRDWFASL